MTAANEEPIPGWVDNVNGFTGILTGVGCGLLRACFTDPSCAAEIVPVDLVVNAMISIAYDTARSR